VYDSRNVDVQQVVLEFYVKIAPKHTNSQSTQLSLVAVSFLYDIVTFSSAVVVVVKKCNK